MRYANVLHGITVQITTCGLRLLACRPAAVADGQEGDDAEHGGDEGRRRPGGELVDVGEQQLGRDRPEDDGQARPQARGTVSTRSSSATGMQRRSEPRGDSMETPSAHLGSTCPV
jgi:hypothetical protein